MAYSKSWPWPHGCTRRVWHTAEPRAAALPSGESCFFTSLCNEQGGAHSEVHAPGDSGGEESAGRGAPQNKLDEEWSICTGRGHRGWQANVSPQTACGSQEVPWCKSKEAGSVHDKYCTLTSTMSSTLKHTSKASSMSCSGSIGASVVEFHPKPQSTPV